MLKSIAKKFAPGSGHSPSGKMTFHPSRTCPECGSKLCSAERRGERPRELLSVQKERFDRVSPHHDISWCCPNPDCPAQIRARVEHWCSHAAMDIAGADPVLVAKLVGAGLVRDVAELYRLKPAEIAGLEGTSKSSAKNFCDAINASRKRDAWPLLFGLDIPQVTAVEAQSLCRHFGSVDNVFAAGEERLSQVEGVSPESARRINQWHSDGVNRRLVRRLFKAGLNFKAG